jgi:transcription elongation factor Elf1
MKEDFKVVSECYLCGKEELQIINSKDSGGTLMQCIHCGYSSNNLLEGKMDENEYFSTLDDQIKKWSKESNNFIWTPSILNLQNGMIYPINDENNNLKWAFASLVKINEAEKEEYKKPDGTYFENRYDVNNQKLFDEFNQAVFQAEKDFKKENPLEK